MRAAQRRGFTIDARTLDKVETKTFRQLRGDTALEDAVQGLVVSDPTPNESLLLMAAHEAGIAPDLTTGVMARRMARWQHDGHWTTSDFRPPHSSSEFTATATAVRAIRAYMPPELAGECDAAIARAPSSRHCSMQASSEQQDRARDVAADDGSRRSGQDAAAPRPWRRRIAA